jgi:hypothetical protein
MLKLYFKNFNFYFLHYNALSVKLIYFRVFKKLYTFRKGFFGKSSRSPIYLRRKSPKSLQKKCYLNSNISLNFMQMSLMVAVGFTSLTNKFYSFYKNAANVITIFSYSKLQLFSFSIADTLNYFLSFDTVNSFSYIGNLSINSTVMFLSSIFDLKIKYARAFKSEACLISYNASLSVYSIKLPSNVIKIFFSLSRALLINKITMIQISESYKKNAGYSNKNGFRPKVRGVAMNPVDHPHGGRTKSIKLPRTP